MQILHCAPDHVHNTNTDRYQHCAPDHACREIEERKLKLVIIRQGLFRPSETSGRVSILSS